jgi:hypothetical protein
MRIWLLGILSLTLLSTTTAQKFTVTEVSDKISWRVGVGNFTALPNGDFLSVAYEGGAKLSFSDNFSGDVVLRWYGIDLNEKKSATLALHDIRSDIGLLNIYRIGRKNCLFYAQKAGKNTINIQCIELDSTTLKAVQELTIISLKIDEKPKVQITGSLNGNYLLIKTRNYADKMESVEYCEIDGDLKNLRTIKYNLPGEQSIKHQIVTNTGEVYLTFQNNAGKKDEDFSIYKFEGTSSAIPQKTQVALNSKSPVFLLLWENRVDNKCYLLGVYMNEYPGRYNGAFFTEIPSKKGSLITPVFKEFDEELLSLLDKDGFAHKRKGLDRDYAGINMITRDDGSMDLVFEYNGRDLTGRLPAFISGSVVDIHFRQGQISFNRVPKSQRNLTTNSYHSVCSYNLGNKIIFLYNEVYRNLDDPIEYSPSQWTNPNNSVLTAVVVDENDKITRKKIWDNGDAGYASEPLSFVRLKNKNVLLVQSKVGFSNYKYRMALLTYE